MSPHGDHLGAVEKRLGDLGREASGGQSINGLPPLSQGYDLGDVEDGEELPPLPDRGQALVQAEAGKIRPEAFEIVVRVEKTSSPSESNGWRARSSEAVLDRSWRERAQGGKKPAMRIRATFC